MDLTKITIIIVIIIIILFLFNKQEQYENFTNDEAIQNVASLYNSGLATVTNFTTTGTATINNLTAPTATITNLTAPSATINNLNAPTANINNLTSPTGNINNLTTQTGNIGNLNTSNANISNLTISSSNIPVIPLTVSQINLNQSWGWDGQIWSPVNGIGSTIFPAISAKLKTMPVGSVVIFVITGNSNAGGLGQATIITTKLSNTQYTYSPIQGQLLNI